MRLAAAKAKSHNSVFKDLLQNPITKEQAVNLLCIKDHQTFKIKATPCNKVTHPLGPGDTGITLAAYQQYCKGAIKLTCCWL